MANLSTSDIRAVVSLAEADFSADHFSLFGLSPRQETDIGVLEQRFRERQTRAHPDRHILGSPAEQRVAMQWASRINEAYQTLRRPLSRARYLLQLLGHDVQLESNTSMSMEFLLAQMELREAVAEAKVGADDTALDHMRRQLAGQMKHDFRRLQALIDSEHDLVSAAELVRQLMFQEKLLSEIEEAEEAVLG